MTEQTPDHEHPVIHADAWQKVEATAHERLAQLHASYAGAKADAEGANERLKAITDAIKAELPTLAPDGSTKIALVGEHGPTLQMTYSERWTVDSRKLKREDPETYVRYAKKSGSWTLRPATEGGDE